MIDYLKSLEAQKYTLKIENDLVRQKILDAKERENREIECKNCKLKFVPFKNHNLACNYHPGKLKFYSCRTCGDDPYMTCCMTCKNCNGGCKTGHHVA